MKSMSAKEAKNGFGLLLDTARAEPVTIEKHGRPVVVVLSTEEYDRLLSGSSRKKRRLGRTDDEVVDRQLKRDRIGKAQAR
ncbi:MAG: type II toxin-antitoxin system Phd/YefM family antitoxin [Oricola sp.]|jgi:prevent-host-death family protein|nr:type II toxin-antitoxin system Phd/YefM family antitoxin [Oricola sp.]